MAALERLSVAQVRSGDLLSAHHVHRYTWAAELCRGLRVVDLACGEGYGSDILSGTASTVLGVDRDAAALAEARRHFDSASVRFERSEAGPFVRRPLHEDHDVLVCFEGLEHFDDLLDVLEQLRYLATAGMKMVLSLPNEDKFVEDNHFHVQTFSWREVSQLVATFPGALTVQQFLAEGSVIAPVGAEPPTTAEASVVNRERFEPDYANHWIFVVGFDEQAVRAASGRLNVATSPNYNSYMLALERANAELLRINAELQQEQLGLRDSAAAGRARRIEGLEERYDELVARYSAPRYRAMDAARSRLLRAPAVSVTWWALRQQLRRSGLR